MDETAPNSPHNPQAGDSMSAERQQQFDEAQVARVVAELRASEARGGTPGVSPLAEAKRGIKAMADFDPDDPAAAEQLSPQEREWQQSRYSGGRKMEEIISRETERFKVRRAERLLVSSEELAVYLGTRKPSEFIYDHLARVMDDRVNELKAASWGDVQIVKSVNEQGEGRNRKLVPTFMEDDEMGDLFEEFEDISDEFVGRTGIMDLYFFKQQFAGDVNGFLGMLEARGAHTPQARHFTLMGQLPESHEGGKQIGRELVDPALHLWVDLAENRRAGAFDKGSRRPGHIGEGKGNPERPEDGIPEEDRIDNPWSDYSRADNLARSVNFIVGQLTGRAIPNRLPLIGIPPKNLSREERRELTNLKRDIEINDALEATILSYGLFKVFDFHLTYSVNLEKGKNGKPDKLSLSVSQVDASKAAYTGLRQVGEEDRDHPYNAGLPLAAGVFPNLAKNFFESTTVAMVSTNAAGVEETRRVDLMYLWREKGIPLGDLPLDKENWAEALRYLEEKFPNMRSWKEYEGITEHAWLVPYKLAHDYAGNIFNLLFNSKSKDVSEVAQNPDATFALNKPFGLGFEITYGSSGMTNDDIEALRQFTKVNWLAEANTALSSGGLAMPDHKTQEQRKSAPLAGQNAILEDDLRTRVDIAAQVSGFMSPEVPGKPGDTRLKREKELFNRIIREKRAYMPHDLIETYFKDEAQVKRIYNSGAYDYNPNLWNILEGSEHPEQHDLLVRLMEDRHKMLKERIE